MQPATLIRSQPLLKLAVVSCSPRRALRAALPALVRRRKSHVRRAA